MFFQVQWEPWKHLINILVCVQQVRMIAWSVEIYRNTFLVLELGYMLKTKWITYKLQYKHAHLTIEYWVLQYAMLPMSCKFFCTWSATSVLNLKEWSRTTCPTVPQHESYSWNNAADPSSDHCSMLWKIAENFGVLYTVNYLHKQYIAHTKHLHPDAHKRRCSTI